MSVARSGAPGPLLGSGRSAAIYDLGRGRILRRYHDPARSARGEADVMSWAAAHGVPVPRVVDTDGPDIVMERMTGPTMFADLARRPWRLFRYATDLAKLHDLVHAVPAPDGLRAPVGAGGVLLHMDLHPENVLLSERGPVVIDWEGACRGPAEADLALSWLIIATSEAPGSLWQRMVGRAGQRLFAESLLRQAGHAVTGPHRAGAASYRLLDPHLRPGEAVRVRRVLNRSAALPG